jgi:hypothetical protein
MRQAIIAPPSFQAICKGRFDLFSEPGLREFLAILRAFSAISRAKYTLFVGKSLLFGRPFFAMRDIVCVFAHIRDFF